MFKNYFKIVLRGLLNNKGYSILNIFGLAIGITCAALIFLWVQNELNYNDTFPNKNYIYNIPTNQDYNGKIYTFDATPAPLAPTLKEKVPGIQYATRYNDEVRLVTLGEKSLYKSGAYVDDDFFTMFSLQFVEGSLENVKSDINGIVITQKTARLFFKTYKNVVGKTLRFDNTKDYKITGVIADLPNNVSLKFDWLASYKSYESGKEYLKYWGNNSTSTYVQLAPKANVAIVNKAVKKIIPANSDNKGKIYGFLHSMNNWHLRDNFENGVQSGGQITHVRLFAIIALIILIIACINFMNLSTARSEKRAKEVGIRKVLGSKRSHLILQFFLEAFVITTLATLVSIVLVKLLLPLFNQFIGKELHIGLTNPIHILALISIILFCSLLSGFYPALYLSSFKPASILKGIKNKQGGSVFIRNGLVITQFAASIILIISTIIVYTQINHVKNRNVGFNKSNLVAINVRGDILKKFDGVKQEMLNTGMIAHVGLSSLNILNGGYNGSGLSWEGKSEDFDPLISFRFIDSELIPTLGMKIVEGHNFYNKSNGKHTEIIITTSLAKMMGDETAIGKLIRRNNEVYEVVGVVKDFLYGSMYSKSNPVIFFNEPQQANYIYARIKENTPVEKAIAALSGIIKKNNPAFPFEYSFAEDTFNNKFYSEMFIGKLARWFAMLAILISSFGLFGLAAYSAEQRSKEIGIRKVLGANVSSVVHLLSKDFLKLVTIAIVIAIPIAWFVMNNWLQDYKYRIDISWWMFAIAALLAILIALFTVSFQAIKTAIQNPVKSLRSN